MQSVARTLRGPLGAGALIADPVASAAFEHRATELGDRLVAIEARLDSAAGDATEDADDIEARNAALVACKDAVWALQWDRLGDRPGHRGSRGARRRSAAARSRATTRSRSRSPRSTGSRCAVATPPAFTCSSPVTISISPTPTSRGCSPSAASDPLFASGSVRVADGHLAFVYKTAAEIGELGDNTARLRAQIRADDLLRLALRSESARTAVLSHTRWASVGIISEPNAHPLNHEELADRRTRGPYVTAALNGDVDNYADLKALESLRLPPEITTDAKVIPALVSRRHRVGRREHGGVPLDGRVVRRLGRDRRAVPAPNPDQILLALRGSGQALYVGLGDDCFVVASEPYGVVEECDRYLRLDGETMLDAGNPASQGQIVVVDARARRHDRRASRASSYDGRALPVAEAELQTPEITTRDVARGDAAHYLLKEMAEAPDVVPQDAARPDRRARRPARRAAAGRDADAGDPRAAAQRVDPARARRSARAARTSPGRASPACCATRSVARPVTGRGADRDRAVGLRARRPT